MKLTTLAVAALLPFAALGAPTAPDDAAPTPSLAEIANVERDAEAGTLEKRAVTGTVKVNGLKYRTCPRTSCTAVGQYAKGTHISLSCYTRANTTPVNGDKGWGKMTNGYYVALGYMTYVSWPGQLPAC